MPTGTDMDFARRSVIYLIEHNCRADEIVHALTTELGLVPEIAHALVSETAQAVAA